ncbi:MAG: septal ring lytic transglycosylase RlpA family protein [Flavobacteriaceae bacterium]|nr:septal ring lytic transglycosylase RlpA family protein [Flavobacteriaceae bacterium]
MKRLLIIIILGISLLSLLSMNTFISDDYKTNINAAPTDNKDSLVIDSNSIEEEEEEEIYTNKGIASWYGSKWHGKITASGKEYDMNALTAAHKTLPFGTKVKLRNPENGKEVIVTITDRGPFIKFRIFDLSKSAFKELGDLGQGVLNLEYKVLD